MRTPPVVVATKDRKWSMAVLLLLSIVTTAPPVVVVVVVVVVVASLLIVVPSATSTPCSFRVLLRLLVAGEDSIAAVAGWKNKAMMPIATIDIMTTNMAR
jgi:ABC-type dipeptide/oligopeptide/nickel transport system permease component